MKRVHVTAFSSLLLLASLACRPSTEHLSAIASEAQPVIDALERYRSDHEVYPDSLDELVPDYVSVIPSSLMYRRESDYAPKEPETFELEVMVSGIGWFVYWPEEEYPEDIYGGGIMEIIDGWCLFTS